MIYSLRISFLILCCLSVTGWAQVTYQQSDYAGIGDTFVISEALPQLGLNLGQDGSGLSWDVSSLVPTNQRVARFGDPDQAGYRLTWIAQCVFQGGNPLLCPNQWDNLTNLSEDALEQSSGLFDLLPIEFSDRTRHYNLANDYLVEQMLGLSVGNTFPIPLTIDFTQPDTLLKFPLTLGLQDSSFGAYEIDYSSFGVPYASFTELRRVRHVSGEGSLTTPFATYPNVLKLETLIEQRDSIKYSADSSIVLSPTLVEYLWFDPAIGHPVMKASGRLVAGIPLFTSIEYLDTLQCIDPSAFFLTFPNPVIYDLGSSSAEVTFTNLAQNADSLRWEFGDGNIGVNVSNPTHTYQSPGVFTAQLIACNTTCVPPVCDTFALPVAVIDTTVPLAFFSPDADEACVNAPVSFDNNSFNADTYAWDFGDGTTSTQESPTHTYTQADTYTVQLIAINGGNQDTATATVEVREAPTVEAFPDTTIDAGQSVSLQSTVTSGPVSYEWSPAAGLSCTTCPNPTANPSSTTTYTLEVSSICGQDVDIVEIVVNPVLGIQSPVEQGFSLYPNPTQGQLTLKSTQVNLRAWQVIDVMGRAVQQGVASTSELTINLGHLPAGVYTIQVDLSGHPVQRLLQIQP